MDKTFSDYGIVLPAGAAGEIDTQCPECSPGRKKQRDPCLSVSVEKGTWFCHHCGWTGGLHLDADQDAQSRRPPYQKPEYKALTDLPPGVLGWFAKRGITERTLADNKVGFGKSFGEKVAVQFPYYKNGQVVNIKHRSQDKQFRQEKGAEKCLYRYDEIAKVEPSPASDINEPILIITEGEIDALSYYEIGLHMVTSIPDGAPSANAQHFTTKFDFLNSAAEILERYPVICLSMDADAAGFAAESELARRIGYHKCFRIRYPKDCKDANDVLRVHGKKALGDCVRNAEPYPIDGVYKVSDFVEPLIHRYRNGGLKGLSVGWPNLDDYYNVLPGHFTVVTGIPSHGKSEFVDAIVTNMARLHGWRTAFFSPENQPMTLHAKKLLEKSTEVPFDQYNPSTCTIRMAEGEITGCCEMLDDYFRLIQPTNESATLDAILDRAAALIRTWGLNALVIDPWNRLEHQYGKGDNEVRYLTAALNKISAFTRRHEIHIWIVAHPRLLGKEKDGTYPPPTMYDISGGAQWRNIADNGLCVHRPSFDSNLVTIIVQKVRFKELGCPGEVKMKYNYTTGTYLPYVLELVDGGVEYDARTAATK